MAEALAGKLFGRTAHIESAGTFPCLARATPETIEVMKSGFGVDLAGHRPRSVSDISLDDFDHIIAMDSSVFQELAADYPDLKPKIIEWDIEDPYGQSLSRYKECAQQIEKHVQSLFKRLVH